MAIAAFAAEKDPTEDGDVVVRLDGCLTARAVGRWGNNGFAFRNAGDANIQEAADDDAEKEKEERNHRIDCATGAGRAQCGEQRRVSDG